MANKAKEELLLKEWAPLSDLLQKLPSKHGVFGAELTLTCVDAIEELIVLGTNLGIIYCYDRATQKFDRLKCEIIDTSVSCIKIISSVEYMVACGNRDGNINIFQIPKKPSDLLPANLRANEKRVERYTVSEMHTGRVTALEWSKNAMKLFSGDINGRVVLTEIDFHMHLCKSVEILDEAYHVVQLSYRQHLLLVSTIYRSIICQQDSKWKLNQVGCKDRKTLGHFGGIIKQVGIRPTDLILYCVRPGLRLWEAETNGQVNKTILFKHFEITACPNICLVNPKPAELNRRSPHEKDIRFGIIHSFLDKFLVTSDNRRLYVINIDSMQVIAQINQLRDVLDVAICRNEIFVLEGKRSLIRIAASPEADTNQGIPTNSTLRNGQSVSKLQTSIINVEASKHTNSLKSNLDYVATGEEAYEDKLDAAQIETQRVSPEHSERSRQFEVYNKISQQSFDQEIKYTGTARRKAKECRKPQNEDEVSLANASNCIAPVSMTASLVSSGSNASPTSIWQDINEKENLLADVLRFESVKVNLPTSEEVDLHSNSNEINKLSEHIAILDCRPEADQVEDLCQSEEVDVSRLPECILMPINWSISDINIGSVTTNLNNQQSQQCKFPKVSRLNSLLNDSDLNDWEVV